MHGTRKRAPSGAAAPAGRQPAGTLLLNAKSPAPNLLATGHGGNKHDVRLARSGRVRGRAPWQPRAKSLALLEQVNAVLREYIEHLPLTIRQIFYRLVGAYAYDKTDRAYDRLGGC
jgi:hypothetical protein